MTPDDPVEACFARLLLASRVTPGSDPTAQEFAARAFFRWREAQRSPGAAAGELLTAAYLAERAVKRDELWLLLAWMLRREARDPARGGGGAARGTRLPTSPPYFTLTRPTTFRTGPLAGIPLREGTRVLM